MPILRTHGVHAIGTAAIGAMFHRALAPADIAFAVALALAAGLVAGTALGARRLPLIAGAAVAVCALAGGLAVVGRGVLTIDLVPDSFALFLTVGLPAVGLEQLAVVPFVILATALMAAVALAMREARLAPLLGPTVALAATAALVAPVGFAWWMPAVFAASAGLALLLGARNDAAQLPPLVGSTTDLRRQVVWWRPLVQFVPALLLVAALAAALPHARTVDLRRYVRSEAERIDDRNPLAAAARVRSADPPRPFATVDVEGAPPGRLRLAVLDVYTPTGWTQAADFTITGRTLADDPLYPVLDASEGDDRALDAPSARVHVVPLEGAAAFNGVPTAGAPREVDDPEGVRFAPSAGVLLTPADGPVGYTTRAAVARGAAAGDVTVGRFPPALAECPASGRISAIASELAAGTTNAVERLERVENYLKVRRVFDPGAPGGQTVRSVERFLEQDFARGNLEVFVTSYALLARCAGVPVRVVVGLPEAPVGRTTYSEGDVTAWVETPLAESRWVAFDPLPTPEEQLQQAQLARQNDPEPDEPEPADEPPPPARRVEPLDVDDEESSLVPLVAAAVVVAAGLVALAWALVVPRVVLRRRRRVADPAAAVHAAWAAVTDGLVDRDVAIDGQHTPREVARLAAVTSLVVPRLVEGMAPVVDHARYSGETVSADDAGLAWGYANAILERLPQTSRTRWLPLRAPRRFAARLASTRGVARRREPWAYELPDTALVGERSAPDDVPNVVIAAKIGEGSTGTVYRGSLAPSGSPVAVKVFRYGPADRGFDDARFEWEVRIARQVSGLPHLPVVHDAGITPVSQRPYIVTTLYDGGTLLDRVRRGGPMTASEVIAIGADLASALHAIHQLGVVHADVKPENVFFGDGGWVLGDLGSAWLRAARGPAATLTPPYAAPEVWRGAAPTPVADLYSLALTLLFAATGRVPTASITPAREDVADAFPDHPVMMRALEPDPRRRPRSAADFARQIRPELAPALTARLGTLSLPTPTAAHRRS